ncbi:MAG: deoxyribodipyrimidine photo-lyase, partial [bacterium]|nr:deoxyribodipyrimidine photo-lyase [bacterium]
MRTKSHIPAGAAHSIGPHAAEPTLVWFRRDLRLEDNPALAAAAANGRPVIPVFVWDPDAENGWPLGPSARWWLRRSLESFDQSLRALGSRLTCLRGETAPTLRRLTAATGAGAVYWNRLYEPAQRALEGRVETALQADGRTAASFNAALLVEPWELLNLAGAPYRMFTPFYRAFLGRGEPPPPRSAPERIGAPACWPRSIAPGQLGIESAGYAHPGIMSTASRLATPGCHCA